MSIINPDLWYKIKGKSTKIESKFKHIDTRSRSQKLKDFGQSLLFWKGRKKGMIHTRDLEWADLRYIFFPSKLERYGYMGITFYQEDSPYYRALMPLVLAMDYEAKPKWCPRWFLRFLHVFGDDKSVVRVRNRRLSNLHRKLTKGIQFWDWKTKWSNYDLRISISGPKHLQDLADDIEYGYYSRGRQEELVEQILKLDPNASIIWGSIERFEKQLEELEQAVNTNEK
jgi:hypothetical protein